MRLTMLAEQSQIAGESSNNPKSADYDHAYSYRRGTITNRKMRQLVLLGWRHETRNYPDNAKSEAKR